MLSSKEPHLRFLSASRREALLHAEPGRAEGNVHQHQAEEEPARLRLHRGGRRRAGRVPADQEPGAGRAGRAGRQDGDR